MRSFVEDVESEQATRERPALIGGNMVVVFFGRVSLHTNENPGRTRAGSEE